MQLRGWLRRQFTGGSIKRTIFGVIAAVMFLVWFGAAALGSAAQPARSADDILALLPVYLTLFALLPVVLGNDDRAIAFSQAEIAFLFPGPFRRRDLVLFKMVKLSLGSLIGGLIFANMLRRYSGSFANGVAGATLALIFINLWATLVALLRGVVEERVYAGIRKGMLAALLIGAAAIVWSVQDSASPTAELRRLASSMPARIALAPAGVFAHVFAAASAGESLLWVLACLGMIAVALLLVLAMDKGYMEAALAASQRRQTKIWSRARGAPVPSDRPARTLRLPDLKMLGPARAIVRKQLITAFRTSRGWMIAMVVALGYGYFMSRMINKSPDTPVVVGMLPALLVIVGFLPQALRFDFRSDLDNMDTLKALPVSGRAVTLAEMAVPCALLSLLGWLIACGAAVFADLPLPVLLMVILGTPPIALWVIGLENLMFLLMPTRLYSQGQASMVLSGRRLVLMLAKLGLFVVGGGVVGGVCFGVWTASKSGVATFAAGWGAVALIGALIVLGAARAFARFDVSADMPV